LLYALLWQHHRLSLLSVMCAFAQLWLYHGLAIGVILVCDGAGLVLACVLRLSGDILIRKWSSVNM
jgi:hypothetical protein